MIYGNPVGGSLNAKTYQIECNGGTVEIMAVVVDEETIFDADVNDVRAGKVFATNNGVKVGTRNIPAYNTCAGYRIIAPNEEFKIVLSASDLYDYTKLQCIICPFNTSISDSVAADRVVIDGNLYEVNSSTVLSEVTKDATEKAIKLGITNDSSSSYIIRLFTYKEEL